MAHCTLLDSIYRLIDTAIYVVTFPQVSTDEILTTLSIHRHVEYWHIPPLQFAIRCGVSCSYTTKLITVFGTAWYGVFAIGHALRHVLYPGVLYTPLLCRMKRNFFFLKSSFRGCSKVLRCWKSECTSGRSAVLFDRNLQYQTLFIFSCCPIKAREVYKVVHSKITRRPPPANPRQHFGSSDAGRTYYIYMYICICIAPFKCAPRRRGGTHTSEWNDVHRKITAQHAVQ